MSKSITTRWFIGAWIVAVLASIVAGVMVRNAAGAVWISARRKSFHSFAHSSAERL